MKNNYSSSEVYHGSNFASCCGSRYLKGSIPARPARKWKNQHGEGVTPAKEAQVVEYNMATDNAYGILLVDSKQRIVKNDKFVVKNIKTKNGMICVSTKIKW